VSILQPPGLPPGAAAPLAPTPCIYTPCERRLWCILDLQMKAEGNENDRLGQDNKLERPFTCLLHI